MTNAEKINRLKHLYITAEELINGVEEMINENRWNEEEVNHAIAVVDEMLALFPLTFTKGALQSTSQPALMINLADADDEPVEIVTKENGLTTYQQPENTTVLYQASVQTILEDKKFWVLNYVANYARDEKVQAQYRPLTLAQGKKCITNFPEGSYVASWQEDMMAIYANQVGWFSCLDEEDPVKLEEALALLEKGYKIYDPNRHKYLEDTKTRLLLKLGKTDEAYKIVAVALKRDPKDPDFQDLKKDPAYLAWAKKAKSAAKEEEKAYQQALAEEMQKVTDNFRHPDHPLVQQHAAALNLIKRLMVTVRMDDLRDKDQQGETVSSEYLDGFKLRTCSLKQIESFEQKSGIVLPDEYKAYLLEIGSGGEGVYYGNDGVPALSDLPKSDYKEIAKPFPAVGGKIKAPYKLPAGVKFTDGCILLGYSHAQNALYLVTNGDCEGEVWFDTLQYGAEAGGKFAPASNKRLKLLAFLAESIQATIDGIWDASEEGDWL
ncbi:hypothetical protein SAMN05428949_5689 [Chitinophaga sp. YR627]|uniref:SMI1/KNR4 family protein n=1 Tax=Chitinophaga sp. YR627 TaxID=1881041 RepID=UPI0008DEF187|nr:SMI1/KNR4 family protein [Chitinophaga sp. YR627]SFO54798.1 hypothetical protein SAMN05428949_5689 [Chitinophaga sp. YR627]